MGRGTLLIYEECRLLKKTIIDSVFEKMAHPRQAVFLTNPKYAGDERWIEECQSIYITSSRFKSEWWYTTFKKVVVECYNNLKIPYNFFAGDIFLSIMFGLKTKSDYFKALKQSGELDFRMEDLNEALGEAEDAFFSRDSFHKNQLITKAFVPPTAIDIMTQKDLGNRPKEENEYRLLYIDYAFANTTSKDDNDNTVIGCMYGKYNNGYMERGTEYITTCNGGDTQGTDRLIRKLFWYYKCDYIVLDLRNGGEVNYSNLTQEWVNDELPQELWNSHGFTVCNELDLQVVTQSKLDDLKSRTIDTQAIPCIIPITASAEFNSNMWLDLQKNLRQEKIRFLIDDLEFENMYETKKEYYDLTTEEKVNFKMPFIQTTFLIQEAVNLSQEWKEGKVKLTEPRMGTKDRIVSCGYGNYIMTLLENKLLKDDQEDEYNDSDWLFLTGKYNKY